MGRKIVEWIVHTCKVKFNVCALHIETYRTTHKMFFLYNFFCAHFGSRVVSFGLCFVEIASFVLPRLHTSVFLLPLVSFFSISLFHTEWYILILRTAHRTG